MKKRRGGGGGLEERLCCFKSQEDIWVHEDFDCFTHTGQSLDRSQLCPEVLCACVFGGVLSGSEGNSQDLFKS